MLTPDQQRMRAEAMRVIPGVLAAENRHDVLSVRILMRDYWETAERYEVPTEQAWAALFSAAMHWVKELAGLVARDADSCINEVAEMLARSAASWMSEEMGVGGF